MESVFIFMHSSSDDEEAISTKLQRRLLRDKSNLLEIPEKQFQGLYRLSRESFSFILSEMKDKFQRSRRSSIILPIYKLATTLRFIAQGSYQQSVGQDYLVPMGQSTICDHNMVIRYVNGRYGWASHDSGVWNVSEARDFFEELYNNGDRNSWLLGDSGYPLEPWLLTPYRVTTDGSGEAMYNQVHSKARNIIERVFGVSKGRFRCLLTARQLHYSPITEVQIINVCCALHNVCMKFNIQVDQDLIIDQNTVLPHTSEDSEDFI